MLSRVVNDDDWLGIGKLDAQSVDQEQPTKKLGHARQLTLRTAYCCRRGLDIVRHLHGL